MINQWIGIFLAFHSMIIGVNGFRLKKFFESAVKFGEIILTEIRFYYFRKFEKRKISGLIGFKIYKKKLISVEIGSKIFESAWIYM
jgi:hypothetical protein